MALRIPLFLLILPLPLAAQGVPKTVAIPGGAVSVGDPAREIEIPAFEIGEREVTWAEFYPYFEPAEAEQDGVDAVTRPTKAISYFGQAGVPDEFLKRERPLTNVRWHSAVAYCEWLSARTGDYWRLPTEAEWEYAARAGATGAAPEGADEVAWHRGNGGSATHEGGGRKPNAFGLHDVFGNVWEYVLEFKDGAVFDPVLKGGCWSTPAAELAYGARQTVVKSWISGDPQTPQSVWWLTAKDASQGFRVARVATAADLEARRAAAGKVEVKATFVKKKALRTTGEPAFFAEVDVEIANRGDRTLDEVEVMVWYLTPDGKPHRSDVMGSNKPGQATYTTCWPVLRSSRHGGETAQALAPGGTRKVRVDVPQTCDPPDEEVDPKAFGGRATNVRLAP